MCEGLPGGPMEWLQSNGTLGYTCAMQVRANSSVTWLQFTLIRNLHALQGSAHAQLHQEAAEASAAYVRADDLCWWCVRAAHAE